MCTNIKKILCLVLLSVLFSVYAEKIILNSEEFERNGEKIINEELFGSYIPTNNQYVYISTTEDITTIWYFYNINNTIKCLAYVKKETLNSKDVTVWLNTTKQMGGKCRIINGISILGQKNPVLYFWESESTSIKNPAIVPVTYVVNNSTYTVNILKEITDIEISNGAETMKNNLKSVTGLESFPKLESVVLSNFAEVSLKTLKTIPNVKLYFNFCNIISNLNDLIYTSQQIESFNVVSK